MSGPTPTESTLSDAHLEHLAASAIDPDIIAERGYRTITGKVELLKLEGRFSKAQQRVPGILIPVYRLGEPKPYAHVLRPDRPRTQNDKTIKYEWPTGVPACLDVSPRHRDRLGDPTITLWFTEGAKKQDALASVGLTAVNLNGVYGWRGRNKQGGKALLVDFEHIALEGRKVVLAFDSDFATNKAVRMALGRIAAVLTRKGAEVWYLPLPNGPDGKTGVDDYLATLPEGNRLEKLEKLVQPFESAGHGITKAYTHPKTLQDCYHPAGYTMQGDTLMYTNPSTEQTAIVYTGSITVTDLGADTDTQDQTATVAFFVRGKRQTVTLPRHEMAQARKLIEHLGARGAAVHEKNTRQLTAYLTEFATINDQALPYVEHATRLGVLENGGIVAPAQSIGTSTRYAGSRHLAVGADADAYRQALEKICEWPDVWPLWVTLGASLASPAIARLRLRRNPLLNLAGPSGSGKTTIAQFAIGAWALPEGAPFRIEAGRTTRAGYQQALAEAGGLPVFIDEVHTAARPADLEGTVYAFANGQDYTKGSVTGLPRGGNVLRGAVIMAGEATPEFINAGAARRVLYIPAEDFPPLGCEPYSDEGKVRAQILEAAWQNGAGLLGPKVAEAIWSDFEAFKREVKEVEDAYSDLGAWAPAVAAITATLARLFIALDLKLPAAACGLQGRIAEALRASSDRNDPAKIAFEAITGMLAQGNIEEGGAGIRLGGELVAWKSKGVWHVPTTGRAFKERVGESAAQLYGRSWVKHGFIAPAKDGKSTRVVREPLTQALVRVLVLEEVPSDETE